MEQCLNLCCFSSKRLSDGAEFEPVLLQQQETKGRSSVCNKRLSDGAEFELVLRQQETK